MDSTTINNVIKEVRELFNELRSNFSREEIKKIRYNLYKKEATYNFLKDKDGLTDKEKIVLKNISKYLKKLNNDLKIFLLLVDELISTLKIITSPPVSPEGWL